MEYSKTKIILVQEEEPARQELKSALEADGHSVSIAASGAVALDMVKRQYFDIFIADYKLPDMNGIEFIKYAIAISKESVPIMITGLSSLETAVESMRIGVHDFIVKPINIDEIKKNIASIIVEREDLKRGKENLEEIMKVIQTSENVMVAVTLQETPKTNIILRLGFLRPLIALFKLFKKYFWEID
jgi:DNA-binding NtrC family response regulator